MKIREINKILYNFKKCRYEIGFYGINLYHLPKPAYISVANEPHINYFKFLKFIYREHKLKRPLNVTESKEMDYYS
jgi:hypothetical protein